VTFSCRQVLDSGHRVPRHPLFFLGLKYEQAGSRPAAAHLPTAPASAARICFSQDRNFTIYATVLS
jgi:hypothetical protein